MYAQDFVVKSMIIQLTSSWMSSLPVKGHRETKVTVDFKVHSIMCVFKSLSIRLIYVRLDYLNYDYNYFIDFCARWTNGVDWESESC